MAVEAKRGCGYRKTGGMYLVTGSEGIACGRMPLPLKCCAACGAGMHPTRGWTWIDPVKLFGDVPDCQMPRLCSICPAADLSRFGGRAGLLWIGEQFYPTPNHFLLESRNQGISRRISAIPRGFKMGETWIMFAHRKALTVPVRTADIEPDPAQGALEIAATHEFIPGVFSIVRPTRIELILPESYRHRPDAVAFLERLSRRGVTPVYVPDDDRDHVDQRGLNKLERLLAAADEEDEAEDDGLAASTADIPGIAEVTA